MERRVKLVTIASLFAIIAAFGLLAVPQFIIPIDYPTLDSISGYQFFFHAVSDNYEHAVLMKGVSGLGIASIVLMGLSLIAIILGMFKKMDPAKSFLSLLTGILNVAASILFFAMEASKRNVFTRYKFVSVGWVAYVIGGLLVLTGLISIYLSIKLVLQEKKVIASSKSYSYIKK